MSVQVFLSQGEFSDQRSPEPVFAGVASCQPNRRLALAQPCGSLSHVLHARLVVNVFRGMNRRCRAFRRPAWDARTPSPFRLFSFFPPFFLAPPSLSFFFSPHSPQPRETNLTATSATVTTTGRRRRTATAAREKKKKRSSCDKSSGAPVRRRAFA